MNSNLITFHGSTALVVRYLVDGDRIVIIEAQGQLAPTSGIFAALVNTNRRKAESEIYYAGKQIHLLPGETYITDAPIARFSMGIAARYRLFNSLATTKAVDVVTDRFYFLSPEPLTGETPPKYWYERLKDITHGNFTSEEASELWRLSMEPDAAALHVPDGFWTGEWEARIARARPVLPIKGLNVWAYAVNAHRSIWTSMVRQLHGTRHVIKVLPHDAYSWRWREANADEKLKYYLTDPRFPEWVLEPDPDNPQYAIRFRTPQEAFTSVKVMYASDMTSAITEAAVRAGIEVTFEEDK